MSDLVERLRARPWQRDVLDCENVCLAAAAEIERLRAAATSVVNYHLRGCGSLSPARDPVVMARLIEELDRALAGPPKRSEGREGK